MIGDLAERTGKSTQEAQAAKLGISDTALSKYLQGDQVPREATFLKMLVNANIHPQDHLKYLEVLKSAKSSPIADIVDGNRHTSQKAPDEEPHRSAERPPRSAERQLPSAPIWVGVGIVIISLLVYAAASWPSSSSSRADAAPNVSSSSVTPLQCSLVIAPSSPVYADIDDPRPVKFKSSGDRVRLVSVPSRTEADGVLYQAVALPDPRDSSTGIGWMPKADLRPDPEHCARPGRRP
ncbi:helix-turn-helix domain-containing protein [Sphaerisporangium sp. NPDC004334]